MKRLTQSACCLLVCGLAGSVSALTAQNRADVDAVNKVIDQYGQTEDAGDMVAQAKLMAPDRVWVGTAPAGRQTDQAMNMRAQQAQYDVQKKLVPGLQWFTQARDRLVKFYGNGAVAVASFYWYREPVIPAGTSREIAQGIEAAATPVAITLVLEKQGGEWKMVHTTDVERPTAARAAHRHWSLRERCARVTLRADRVPRTPGRGQASRIHRTGNYPPSGRRMGGNLKRRPGHVDGTLIHVEHCVGIRQAQHSIPCAASQRGARLGPQPGPLGREHGDAPWLPETSVIAGRLRVTGITPLRA
ncbi:MAG: hypothetical protein DMD46_05875 [Gemmatimonadetes bacterium]|nr:MAG: hypothetical protein DMD46_05875 [Gemmatimonadota bacterium]